MIQLLIKAALPLSVGTTGGKWPGPQEPLLRLRRSAL